METTTHGRVGQLGLARNSATPEHDEVREFSERGRHVDVVVLQLNAVAVDVNFRHEPVDQRQEQRRARLSYPEFSSFTDFEPNGSLSIDK